MSAPAPKYEVVLPTPTFSARENTAYAATRSSVDKAYVLTIFYKEAANTERQNSNVPPRAMRPPNRRRRQLARTSPHSTARAAESRRVEYNETPKTFAHAAYTYGSP